LLHLNKKCPPENPAGIFLWTAGTIHPLSFVQAFRKASGVVPTYFLNVFEKGTAAFS
jgi:hypothetical protein